MDEEMGKVGPPGGARPPGFRYQKSKLQMFRAGRCLCQGACRRCVADKCIGCAAPRCAGQGPACQQAACACTRSRTSCSCSCEASPIWGSWPGLHARTGAGAAPLALPAAARALQAGPICCTAGSCTRWWRSGVVHLACSTGSAAAAAGLPGSLCTLCSACLCVRTAECEDGLGPGHPRGRRLWGLRGALHRPGAPRIWGSGRGVRPGRQQSTAAAVERARAGPVAAFSGDGAGQRGCAVQGSPPVLLRRAAVSAGHSAACAAPVAAAQHAQLHWPVLLTMCSRRTGG